jgi:hypothetical protein
MGPANLFSSVNRVSRFNAFKNKIHRVKRIPVSFQEPGDTIVATQIEASSPGHDVKEIVQFD